MQLCLIGHVWVEIPFLRVMHLLYGHHNCEEREVQRKRFQTFLLLLTHTVLRGFGVMDVLTLSITRNKQNKMVISIFFLFFIFICCLKSKIRGHCSRRENCMRSKHSSSSCWSPSLATCVGQMASHPSSGICRRFATLVKLVTLARNSTFKLKPQVFGWGWGRDCWQATPFSSEWVF